MIPFKLFIKESISARLHADQKTSANKELDHLSSKLWPKIPFLMIAEILGKYEISFDPRNITRSLDGEVDLDILYSGLPVVNSKLVIVWYHMGQGSFKIRSYLK